MSLGLPYAFQPVPGVPNPRGSRTTCTFQPVPRVVLWDALKMQETRVFIGFGTLGTL
jgi:hypothetical protein